MTGGRTEGDGCAAANGAAVEAARAAMPEMLDSMRVGVILKQNGREEHGKDADLVKGSREI
jgi:hypothetical protein